jgi:thiol-disulfide isomerase/thioredoxin
MKKFIFILCLLSFSQNIFAGSLMPYQKGDWESILKKVTDEKVVIHFWGVTCAPCVKEMPLWGNFLKNNQNTKVIFIQVDDVTPESMQKMLNKAGLEKANNYFVVGPFDERLRYEIDPKWHGETPTTMLIDKNGKATRKTGLMNFQQLQSSLIAGREKN